MHCGDSSVVIVGGGTMGGDISLLFAMAGWNVYIVEPVPERREELTLRIKNIHYKDYVQKVLLINS